MSKSALLAGAGKACINPPTELFPFGAVAANAKVSNTPLRSEMHDDCFVRALVLDNGESRSAIVAFDLACPPPDEAKDIISEIAGVSKEQILMCATHNHDYPLEFTKFIGVIYDGIREAVSVAVATMRPARYGFGTGESHINMNRDFQTEDGNWTANMNTKGYSDKTLAILKIVDEEDKLIAAVMNYCAHATLVTSHLDFDGKLKVSSDFPGYACGYVERRFGNDAVVMWTSGAAGDQCPLFMPYLLRYEDDGYVVRDRMPNGMAYMLIESLGGQHAIDAIQIINSITADKVDMPIKTATTTVGLPAQKAPEGADMKRNRLVVDHLVPLGPNGERFEGEPVKMVDDPNRTCELDISLLQLGDVALVYVPNELYCGLGREIKLASPVENTVVVTLAGTSKCRGYILDKDSADHNSFPSYGPFKPGAGDEIIIQGMLGLFEKTK